MDFGNGIILDYNNNLCVDLLRFYRMDDAEEFLIAKSQKGWSLFDRQGFYALKQGSYESSFGMRRATIGKERVDVEVGLLGSKRTIEIGQDRVSLKQGILGSVAPKSARLVGPTTLEVTGFWKDVVFSLQSPDRITMGNYLQVINNGDHISTVYTGIFGLSTKRTFLRTAEGFVFFDDMERGVEVLKKGNTILVRRNGRTTTEYTIASLTQSTR